MLNGLQRITIAQREMKFFKGYSKNLMFNEDKGFSLLERKPRSLWWGVKSNTCEWDLKLRSNFLKGFTLIELILVLVIIGFLTSLVAPAITSLTGLKLKTAVRRVAAGLRYARSQAVTTGSDYQVIFNLEKGEITIGRLGSLQGSTIKDRPSVDRLSVLPLESISRITSLLVSLLPPMVVHCPLGMDSVVEASVKRMIPLCPASS